jgi:hypothetical protein
MGTFHVVPAESNKVTSPQEVVLSSLVPSTYSV